MSSSVVHCGTPRRHLKGSARHADESSTDPKTCTHPVQLGQKHGVLSAPAWVPMAALSVTGGRAVSSTSTTASSSAVCTLAVLVLSLRVVGHGIRGKRVRLRRGRPGLRLWRRLGRSHGGMLDAQKGGRLNESAEGETTRGEGGTSGARAFWILSHS